MGGRSIRSLHLSLMRVARFQGEHYNPMELQECVESIIEKEESFLDPKVLLDKILRDMGLSEGIWIDSPDASKVPAIVWDPVRGWGVLRGQGALGLWAVEYFSEGAQDWREEEIQELAGFLIARISLARAFSVFSSNMFSLVKQELLLHKGLLFEASLGGIGINLIALASSFYSMQVYDRVMPTGGMQTLTALTIGVVISTALELCARISRSRLYDRLIDAADSKLARAVFLRFLSIRLDQMPKGLGSVAGQLRGYEMVRVFLTSITTQVLVDLPFAAVFLFIIAIVAGQLLLIPLVFLVFILALAAVFRKRMEHHSTGATNAANMKTGLLVEAIQGSETIKSVHAGWRVLAKWVKLSDDARYEESSIRKMSEYTQHSVSALQQLAYVGLLAFGAVQVTKGSLTMGSLVAVTILSSRVLAPIGTIPAQLMQWGNLKSGLKGLDELWRLKDDHHNGHPIQLDNVRGDFKFENVQSQYMLTPAITIPSLEIRGGEKVGVIGPIGAGKTTLLRLLSGMYKPQSGRVLLDGFDISYITKPILAAKIGYLQQDGRLFAGTVRENLVMGMIDPGDERIMSVANELGLAQSLIDPHPMGLNLEITEGGIGLSGGQKQLLNLTRIFLRRPNIWLLDEPTASMDPALESKALSALKNRLSPTDTLVLVTHKPELLAYVDRLVVVASHQIVLDGPKEVVLQRLKEQEGHLKDRSGIQ